VPRKVRELLAQARKEGFSILPGGRGSHRKVVHPLVPGSFTISGQEGDDAQPYQEQELRKALRKLEQARKKQP